MNNIIIFLGTGSSMGNPVIGSKHEVCKSINPKDIRFRSSIFLKIQNKKILIDCSPDFRQQALKNKIYDIDFIFFTHEHNDHVLGLDELRPIIFNNNKTISIYGLDRTLKEIVNRFPYVFSKKKYSEIIKFKLNTITENENIKIENFNVQPLKVFHGNLPILAYKLENLVYITDAKFISTKTLDIIKNCNILIINSLNQDKKHDSHLTLNESLELISKINPKKTYITHISHKMGFHYNIEKKLPENVFLAYDGLKLYF